MFGGVKAITSSSFSLMKTAIWWRHFSDPSKIKNETVAKGSAFSAIWLKDLIDISVLPFFLISQNFDHRMMKILTWYKNDHEKVEKELHFRQMEELLRV